MEGVFVINSKGGLVPSGCLQYCIRGIPWPEQVPLIGACVHKKAITEEGTVSFKTKLPPHAIILV